MRISGLKVSNQTQCLISYCDITMGRGSQECEGGRERQPGGSEWELVTMVAMVTGKQTLVTMVTMDSFTTFCPCESFMRSQHSVTMVTGKQIYTRPITLLPGLHYANDFQPDLGSLCIFGGIYTYIPMLFYSI